MSFMCLETLLRKGPLVCISPQLLRFILSELADGDLYGLEYPLMYDTLPDLFATRRRAFLHHFVCLPGFGRLCTSPYTSSSGVSNVLVPRASNELPPRASRIRLLTTAPANWPPTCLTDLYLSNNESAGARLVRPAHSHAVPMQPRPPQPLPLWVAPAVFRRFAIPSHPLGINVRRSYGVEFCCCRPRHLDRTATPERRVRGDRAAVAAITPTDICVIIAGIGVCDVVATRSVFRDSATGKGLRRSPQVCRRLTMPGHTNRTNSTTISIASFFYRHRYELVKLF